MTVVAVANFFEPWWIQIIKALVIFGVVLAVFPVLTVYERKLMGRLQGRYGPNRVGPFGLLQPMAEIVKFATKEPFRPRTSIGWLFRLAPAIALLTAVSALAIIPYGDVQHIFGRRVGLYGIDVSIGPLFVFAFAGISFYSVMLGGWSSGSKFAFLGSMRSAAQLISYEVSQGLALIGAVITAGTLSLTGIVHAQGGMWYVVPQLGGFLIFMTASLAEINRPRRGARRRLQHRVRRHPVRRLPVRRVPEHDRRRRRRDDGVPRRLAAAVRDQPARLGRPDHRVREDDDLHHVLHLDPVHGPARAV